jgi:hypothetical protein
MYSYFNNGFSYSSSGFSQYAPVAVKTAVKGYVDALRSLIERDKNDASSFPSNNFIEQYVLNHPDIIPEINMEDFPKAEISDVSITIPVGEDETIDSLASPHGGWLRYVTIITEDNGVETQRIYRNVTEKDDDHVTLEYVVPLGSNNDAIEYDYHFNRDNIIRRSDILKAPVVADIQRVNERIEEAPVESND